MSRGEGRNLTNDTWIFGPSQTYFRIVGRNQFNASSSPGTNAAPIGASVARTTWTTATRTRSRAPRRIDLIYGDGRRFGITIRFAD